MQEGRRVGKRKEMSVSWTKMIALMVLRSGLTGFLLMVLSRFADELDVRSERGVLSFPLLYHSMLTGAQ